MKIKLNTLFIALASLSLTGTALSSTLVKTPTELSYRTFFGNCPSRTAGSLTMDLVKEFERTRSLRSLRTKIISERLDEKHFISEYSIRFNPYQNILFFQFDCPKPLMKVQIYRNGGASSYEAILVEDGKLYDPTYEVLLRSEGKISAKLPHLGIPVGEFDSNLQYSIAQLVSRMHPALQENLAEVILNERRELTLILSVNNSPVSIFMGPKHWGEKAIKLERIIGHMEDHSKIPAIINLTNLEKVVVKFNAGP